jgi:hypothetical protein
VNELVSFGEELARLWAMFEREKYLMRVVRGRTVLVSLKAGATPRDQLQAYFQVRTHLSSRDYERSVTGWVVLCRLPF